MLMAAGSLALLVVLGIADPGSRRLMPSLFSNAPVGELPEGAIDRHAIQRTIGRFNRALSAAYLALDRALLAEVAMTDGVRRTYTDEIAFLGQDGRVLELAVLDIRIERVSRLPNLMLSVDTIESVQARELNSANGTRIAGHSPARYRMNYLLEEAATGWKIAGVETMKVEAADE